MERVYLVIYNHAEAGVLGVHAAGSTPQAEAEMWLLMQDEALFCDQVIENAIVDDPIDEPGHGLRQICLGIETAGGHRRLVKLDASNCPNPTWQPLHPAWDFEALSGGETPAYIKRWLAFEAWEE